MNKIKKGFFIIMPLILAIYQVYLVNRIWDFSKKISLMIGIFCACALYFIFYLFYKKINYKEISKRSMILVTIFSLLLSGIILGMDFDFFSKKYKETTVTLYQENQEEVTEIPIKSVIVDNVPQTLEDFQKVSPIELNFNHCKDVTIVLEREETKKNQTITIKDGEHETKVEWNNNIYQYQVKSNKSMTTFSMIRLVISFIMIEMLSFIVCLSSYYMYKKKKSLLIPILVLIAIIRILFYQQTILYIVYNDSIEYQNYSFSKLFSGELQDRVPIYPLLIKIFMFICNDLWRNFICIVQMIVSFISLIYLYKTLKLIIKWESLVATITFLYGVSIAVIGWDTAILTESLALSSTIWFCYFIISYLKTNQLKYGIFSVILIFLMTFLRPSFIGFVAILFAFFVLKMILDKENRKKDRTCLITSAITIVMILGYAFAFYKQYDIFSITKASVRQDLYVCMHQGFYKNSKDEQFIKDVEESIQTEENQWSAMVKVLGDYGNKRVQELVKISKKESMKQYINYLINLVNTYSNEYFDAYYTLCVNDVPNMKYNLVRSFLFLKFSTVYFIIVIEGFISLYRWIKDKKPNWIHLGLFGFMTAILATSFIGTNGEFMRTAICVVPFSYIAIGTVISDGIEKYKRQERNEENERKRSGKDKKRFVSI